MVDRVLGPAELGDKILVDRTQFEYLLALTGQLHAARVRALGRIESLAEAEFKVFSQFGEDGIIQYLTSHVDIRNRFFVEFGVQNYEESNTRFLLMNDKWAGLVLDGSKENIDFIRRDRLYYRHSFDAVQAFVTAENINDLLRPYVRDPDIGLLSVDIDGNDYWIWRAIDIVRPRIVVCEYNSLFGCEHAVAIPYDPAFIGYKAHSSCLYFGASILALCDLAKTKGYEFVGCDSEGVDAFFVRSDVAGSVKTVGVRDGFVKGKYRISRDERGQLTYLPREAAKRAIADTLVEDVRAGKVVRFGDLDVD